jgi:ankyrin repeat protein
MSTWSNFSSKKGPTGPSPNNDGWTPLNCALYSGHVDLIKFLFNRRGRTSVKDSLGRTPLFYAIKHGQNEAFDLLKTKLIQMNTKDYYGTSALSVAARCGRKHMVNQLLAIPNIDIRSKDSLGRTPLWWARKQRHIEIAERLLEHATELGLNITIEMEIGDPALFDTKSDYCDVCLASINEAYYCCAHCNGGDFLICLEC